MNYSTDTISGNGREEMSENSQFGNQFIGHILKLQAKNHEYVTRSKETRPAKTLSQL